MGTINVGGATPQPFIMLWMEPTWSDGFVVVGTLCQHVSSLPTQAQINQRSFAQKG